VGEQALLLQEKRNATVQAKTACTLGIIRMEQLQELVTTDPNLVNILESIYKGSIVGLSVKACLQQRVAPIAAHRTLQRKGVHLLSLLHQQPAFHKEPALHHRPPSNVQFQEAPVSASAHAHAVRVPDVASTAAASRWYDSNISEAPPRSSVQAASTCILYAHDSQVQYHADALRAYMRINVSRVSKCTHATLRAGG